MDKRKPLTLRLPEPLLDRLDAQAQQLRRTRTSLIEEAIEKLLAPSK
ncbi:MAG: ribbon-helix-helix domain-containing protein [Chloroflexi bacterium]|nr:ribbon-helix-helix domain-containing protein [Chloroflexota bacterium]